MKKVIIVLLFVAIMVLSMTGCAFAHTEVVEVTPAEVIGNGSLQFEVKGTYIASKINSESVAYRFEAPNDGIVVYQMPGTIFLVGENTNERNIRYAVNMYIKGGEFVALSDKYILFATGESKGMIAVSIERDTENNAGLALVSEHSFDDLPEVEKDAFVYPVECKTVTK